MRGWLAPVAQDGVNELPVYHGRLVFVWLHESITGVVVREPRVLTCVEHWVPLFAAKQMEVNRQLSFSISPQGQQPLIRKLHMPRLVCVIYDQNTNKHSCLVVSRRDARGEKLIFPSRRCLPVTPFATGIAAGGSGAGAVALGLARVFSRQAAHVLVGVGSPHSADREAGKTWHRTQLNYTMQENGVVKVNTTTVQCVLFTGLQNYAVRWAKCAFQLHCRQPACPFATMERLHQQSIGQRALSPNPACGRNVYSKPKTVIPFWRACVVCWLKSRTEQKAERESDCSLWPPWGIVVIGPQGTGEGSAGLLWVHAKGSCDCGQCAV